MHASFAEHAGAFCVIPSAAEGPQIFLEARQFNANQGIQSRVVRIHSGSYAKLYCQGEAIGSGVQPSSIFGEG